MDLETWWRIIAGDSCYLLLIDTLGWAYGCCDVSILLFPIPSLQRP